MHRNVNIEIVTVQAVADDKHSNPITTAKPDAIVILHADRGIVMGKWIKPKYSDVKLNLDRTFACGCCFHAGKCQPQQTESMLAQFMEHKPLILQQQKVGARVYLTCRGVFEMGMVSRIKNGRGNQN